ncbi:GNAT family N-acetyltransferase [Pendulispora brunnea]|uniref:GNAT family N-acetyltransferase n=1 Tax=Pendulispora brunnea TaxID=2905690 RepID=A0ABZ2KRB7_9BACT
MSLEFRAVAAHEISDYVRVVCTAMGFPFNPDRLGRSSVPEHEIRYAAFDGDMLVGAAGSFTFRMTVPGGVSPEIGGLTHVGVLPTHRRRGILTGLMRGVFEENRKRGQAVSALYASEGVIYGRYGYGMASLGGDIELPRHGTAFVDGPQVDAHVRYVTEDESIPLFSSIWDRVRAESPGMCSRSEGWWRGRRVGDPDGVRAGRPPLQRIVLELEGRPAGYAFYRSATGFDGFHLVNTLDIVEAIADSPAATRALWRWLLDLDLVTTVKASLLPPDHPLFFLLASARDMRMRVSDNLWVRLLDVAAALSQRKYNEGPPIVFHVNDTFVPSNTGRYLLENGTARPTDLAPDLSLDVNALGSAYLGGFTFTQMARAGRILEHTPGALRSADLLFHSPRAPWCPEIF